MHQIVRLRNGRLAIRDGDVLLAVPPIYPGASEEVRARVFDYVARRQIGLAMIFAEPPRNPGRYLLGDVADLMGDDWETAA